MHWGSGRWILPGAVLCWHCGCGVACLERCCYMARRYCIFRWRCEPSTDAATGRFRSLNGFDSGRGCLPLLLIRHAVSTRLASSLYGFEPNYERIVISLITSGTQGLQLALLAPGWLHGCLGLWLRMRHHAMARRAKPILVALLVALPLLSAAGFIQMKQAVVAISVGPLRPDPKLVTHQLALDAWRHHILMLYLSLLISAFVAGQLRNWLERRRLRKAAINV